MWRLEPLLLKGLKNMNPASQLVFSSVTDPKGGRLVEDLSKPESNVTGVSGFIHALPQLRFFKSITLA